MEKQGAQHSPDVLGVPADRRASAGDLLSLDTPKLDRMLFGVLGGAVTGTFFAIVAVLSARDGQLVIGQDSVSTVRALVVIYAESFVLGAGVGLVAPFVRDSWWRSAMAGAVLGSICLTGIQIGIDPAFGLSGEGLLIGAMGGLFGGFIAGLSTRWWRSMIAGVDTPADR